MSIDHPDIRVSPPTLRSGVGRRRARRAGFPAWALFGLAVLAFVLAIFLYPLLFLPSVPDDDRQSSDPGAARVWVLVARGEPEVLLKTPHDHSEADRRDGEHLDRLLFPGGERHLYLMLHVRRGSEGPESLDLGEAAPTLVDRDGKRWAPVDLATVLEGRQEAIPLFLRQQLAEWIPASGRIPLAPGRIRKTLIAYPRGISLNGGTRGLLGGRELEIRSILKDDLDDILSDPSHRMEDRLP